METLTAKECAALLRYRDVDTVYAMLRDGRLRGRRIGGQWRISRAEVDRVLGVSGAASAVRTGDLRARRRAMSAEFADEIRRDAERIRAVMGGR